MIINIFFIRIGSPVQNKIQNSTKIILTKTHKQNAPCSSPLYINQSNMPRGKATTNIEYMVLFLVQEYYSGQSFKLK